MSETQEQAPHARGFEFNADQLEVLALIRAFMESKEKSYFGLFGFAGTGKSSVIHQVVDEYKSEDGQSPFALTAPTHKAVNVLREMAAKYGDEGSSWGRPTLATIHSLLRLRPKKRAGEVYYEPDRRKPPPIRDVDVIVIDECSMVDRAMFALLNEEIEQSKKDMWSTPKKVIFMGDQLQLPPVRDNGEESATFRAPDQYTLTRVMRHGGVIGQTVDRIRDNIMEREPQRILPGKDELGEVRVFPVKHEWYDEFLKRWEGDVDAKVLAFTNAAVDQANNYFRSKLYGEDAPPFVVGEQVVATEAYAPPPDDGKWYDSFDAEVLVRTESQGQVLETRETVHRGLACWRLKVFFHSEGRTEVVYALDSAQQLVWQSELDRARKKKDWKYFWPLKEAFIRLRPAFATTIHKSQGSTYENTFLDYSNVTRVAGRIDHVYRNRLLYVGASRASKSLMVYA